MQSAKAYLYFHPQINKHINKQARKPGFINMHEYANWKCPNASCHQQNVQQNYISKITKKDQQLAQNI